MIFGTRRSPGPTRQSDSKQATLRILRNTPASHLKDRLPLQPTSSCFAYHPSHSQMRELQGAAAKSLTASACLALGFM